MQAPPERLGSFYLGAEYDLDTERLFSNRPVRYDARDLTTHAVCVGMTGSGKTGLCIVLLEEAALDKVPAIIIDPKGDMTNLLLQFDELRPEDFRPWVNVDDARRKGLSVDEYAKKIATQWREGLAEWGITPERIRLLKESVEYTVYTPGSEAGRPVNILGSLAAPGLDFDTHAETLRERISGTVAALLRLAGIQADPVRSREAILLATIFEHFWRQQEDLDLAKLILSIQTPPVRQLGVFDVDTFFPAKERFELAMAFNSLMAAPAFQAWLKGDPLNVDALFFTADGKPRHSIFYLAHLSEAERMFFVTLLLESVVTWMRRQTGTTSLRALLYFDEVFGFFPPVAEPPSKRPLLTLLKQARAFGLGTVLVTQNPVDIDYKGLTNAGTWFIGKLQAERDKERVLQGLKGALAEAGQQVDVEYDAIITRLRTRLFLLHNVHDEGPKIFHTRWAMSYLRGPLTRPQLQQLQPKTQSGAPATRPPAAQSAPASRTISTPATMAPTVEAPGGPSGYQPIRPPVPPDVVQGFVPVARALEEARALLMERLSVGAAVGDAVLVYEPVLLGAAEVHFVKARYDLDERESLLMALAADDERRIPKWESAERLVLSPHAIATVPETPPHAKGLFFAPLSSWATDAKTFKKAQKALADWLYRTRRRTLLCHPTLELTQHPDEDERAFRIRLQQAAREARDEEIDALQKKYEKRFDRLERRLRREEQELAEDEAEYEARKREEMIGLGETVLGLFLGRRRSRGLSSAARKRRMTAKAKRDVEESRQEIAALQEELADLERELQAAIAEITSRWERVLDEIEVVEVKPRRKDVLVEPVMLGWLPFWAFAVEQDGHVRYRTVPAYRVGEDG
nr:DUF87 domain-containing protein [Ardenticatena sp.]